MINKLRQLLSNLYFLIIYLFIAYVFFVVASEIFGTLSVTGMNIALGIITLTIGAALAIGGLMANDSGRGKFFMLTFQFLALSYPLVYLIGLISSIAVLYSDMENKQTIAFWLSCLAGIQLLIIIALFGTAYLKETYDRNRRFKRYG